MQLKVGWPSSAGRKIGILTYWLYQLIAYIISYNLMYLNQFYKVTKLYAHKSDVFVVGAGDLRKFQIARVVGQIIFTVGGGEGDNYFF